SMKNIEIQEKPLITVYIPTHNRSILLKRAVDSVLRQTYENFEIIICDDGSSDNTADYLVDLASRDHRVKFIRNNEPKGACFSRNRCIELAKGEFITGLDDDDEFVENRLQLFMESFQSHGWNIISSNRVFRGNNGDYIGEVYEGIVTKEMLGSRNIIGNQVFTKTKYFIEVGGFDTSFPAWQDYDMWFRVVQKFGPSHRISNASYIFYVDEDRPRITTGSRAYHGYQLFIEKHKNELSSKQLNSLFFQDLLNRNQKIKLKYVIDYFTLTNLLTYIKLSLKEIDFIHKAYYYLYKKK
ncbi:TPA: glycosyltransferase, partial [Klebsiella pneumoniae]